MMMGNEARGVLVAVLLLSAACGTRPAPGNDANASSENAAPAEPNAVANVATAAPAGAGETANRAATAGGPLSKYVGHHPSEAVDGTRFLDEPAVRKAVAANVPDAKIRDFVFNYSGPDAPIVAKNGKILAWGCERHNCGYHNWSVAIAPDGGSAEICFYHNDDSADGPATWYLPGGKTEKRAGNCPAD